MNNKDRWSQLSMQQRADLIKLYTSNGITNIKDIRKHYNSFHDGGPFNLSLPVSLSTEFKPVEVPDNYVETNTKNTYLTDNNYLEEHSKFRRAFEEFYPKAYYDAKGKTYTIGTGLTYLLDDKGREIKVKKGDKITEQENIKQLKLREQAAEEYARNKTPYWDNYHPELKFQILDAMFNAGNSNVWNKSPKYQKALRQYEKDKGWENPDYNLFDIFQHADWNLNDKKWLGVRARMRRNPQSINPEDYKLIYDNQYRDSLYNAYNKKYKKDLK